MSSTKSVSPGKAQPQLLPIDPQAVAPQPHAAPDKSFAKIMIGMMARSLVGAAGADQPAVPLPKPDAKQRAAADKDQNAAPGVIAAVPLPPPPAPVQTVAAPLPVTTSKEQLAMVPAAVVPGHELVTAGPIQEATGLAQAAGGKDQSQPPATTAATPVPQTQAPAPIFSGTSVLGFQGPDGSSTSTAAAKTVPAPSAAHATLAAGNASKGAAAALPPASNEERDAKAVVAAAPLPAATAKPNQSLTRELSPLPAADGTVIARQDNRMKKDVNVDKSSQPAEQNLPGGKVVISAPGAQADPGGKQASSDLPGRKPETPAPSAKPATATFESVAQVVRLDSKPAADEAPAPSAGAAPAAKMLSDVTDQVVTFKNVGVNSMDAVVRPDGATAISLQLSLHNGQVEVAARVDRGNFEGLQSHWGELQSSLAQQGVRVGALHSSSSNNPASSGAPSQNSGAAAGEQQQTPRRGLRSPQTLDELPLVGSVTEPLKAQPSAPTATARRGWEKWA